MKKILSKMRKDILTVSYKQQKGHIPSAFSILEIIFSIYDNHYKEGEDIFLLSKGHGCLALYSVFLYKKYITLKEFNSFCEFDSILGGHPHRKKHSKIYGSTGSLGHGLPVCVGSALAKKIKKEPGYVMCLVGDGECNEGTIWESAILADKLMLDNLICIVDDNNSQIRSIPTNNIKEKFTSFGWDCLIVDDGHSLDKINLALKASKNNNKKPKCIICKTKKGKGIKEMEENMFAWHHGPPNTHQYEKFLIELDVL